MVIPMARRRLNTLLSSRKITGRIELREILPVRFTQLETGQ